MKNVTAILLTMLLATSAIWANNDLPKAKALFIYNFLKYIEWPDDHVQDEYTIGILGDVDVAQSLRDLTNGRNVSGKRIRVINSMNAADLGKCQILFIPQERNSCLAKLSLQLKGSSCLTVYENNSQNKSCASIDLITVEGKLAYRINHEIVRNQDVVISNILVNMAAL